MSYDVQNPPQAAPSYLAKWCLDRPMLPNVNVLFLASSHTSPQAFANPALTRMLTSGNAMLTSHHGRNAAVSDAQAKGNPSRSDGLRWAVHSLLLPLSLDLPYACAARRALFPAFWWAW